MDEDLLREYERMEREEKLAILNQEISPEKKAKETMDLV